jgi:YfiH family protein
VHGHNVMVVDRRQQRQGTAADALVTADEGLALVIFTADCASVALVSEEGPIGAVHAGWSGVARGVLERAVETMRGLGADRIQAALGPCIGPECYEFAVGDESGEEAGAGVLGQLEGRLGEGVRATTSWGTPSLDLPAAVRAALHGVGVELVHQGDCTACSEDRYFSHRARREEERQALFVWRGS